MLRAVRRIPLKNFRFLGNVTKSELIGEFKKFESHDFYKNLKNCITGDKIFKPNFFESLIVSSKIRDPNLTIFAQFLMLKNLRK